jgi:hypothetical protein
MTMTDEEDELAIDNELDEFDMWECRQRSGEKSTSEEQKQAISEFQKLFLDELNAGNDKAEATAKALMRLATSRPIQAHSSVADPAPKQASLPSPEHTLERGARQRAAESFQTLYQEELGRCGDANVAAAAALRKLNQQTGQERTVSRRTDDNGRQQALKALKSMLGKEIGGAGDMNGAVAKALLRVRVAAK